MALHDCMTLREQARKCCKVFCLSQEKESQSVVKVSHSEDTPFMTLHDRNPFANKKSFGAPRFTFEVSPQVSRPIALCPAKFTVSKPRKGEGGISTQAGLQVLRFERYRCYSMAIHTRATTTEIFLLPETDGVMIK